jgi:hypothetical protein
MNKILFVLNLLNILLYSYAYPLSIGPNKFSNGGGNYNNICYLNYNNAYSSFYEWSKKNNLTCQKKILDDTLWLNKHRFISSTVLVGIYNSDDVNNILNYICLLRKTSPNTYKVLNIFSNPSNNLTDDNGLFNNLIYFCNKNDATIDFENLKNIDNSRYYLTYIYKYLF